MSLFPHEPEPPSTEWIHAHCDGGSRGNPGPSGFGAVVTDAAGHPLAELSDFLGVRTNNFAEYAGLLAVLAWALAHGHTRVKVVSDSKLMVEQVNGRYKVSSPDLKPLWQQARERIGQLAKFEITHALRHKNKEADALANAAMDRGMGREPARGGRELSVASLPLRQPLAASAKPAATMLRGFTKGGAVHLLGGATLPDGVFVKVIPE